MKRLLTLLALLLSTPVFAQNSVFTLPSGATTNNQSSTITVTNTFQSIFAASTASRGRVACVVQSKAAADAMYVYFGAIADATIGKSVKLTPGQSVGCSIEGIVLKDQVSITGTSGDAFYAAQQ